VGDHPVKVPAILVGEWLTEAGELGLLIPTNLHHLANRAAQWAADQELEACIKWFDVHIPGYELVADRLRAARRPNPPSLAEQGLKALGSPVDPNHVQFLTAANQDAIRAALNRLAELEANQ
jgi:hypothetical protein